MGPPTEKALRVRIATTVSGLLLLPFIVWFEPVLAGQMQEPAPFERAVLGENLSQAALVKYRAKDYQQAAELFAEVADDSWDPASGHYNAACSFALGGQPAKALAEARSAARLGFRDPLQISADADLNSLHGTPQWSQLVADVERNRAKYQREHSDPERAKFFTSDIDHFWRAYDLAANLTSADDRAQAYRTEYFDRGSNGLIDYFLIKIHSIQKYVAVIDSHPKYYASLRERTSRANRAVPTIKVAFRKMKELYGDSVFPDVYFVVGSFTSGGTTSNSGLLLGVDQAAGAGGAPPSALDELDPSVRAFVEGIGDITSVVSHELVHYQQKTTKEKSLLRDVLVEGSADFIGELTSGHQSNPAAFTFGEAHQVEVWRRFEKDMHGNDDRDWIANGGSDRVGPNWVADLGYYVGYKISKAYYDRSLDKHRAVRDLLEFKDPDLILRESGYAGLFASEEHALLSARKRR